MKATIGLLLSAALFVTVTSVIVGHYQLSIRPYGNDDDSAAAHMRNETATSAEESSSPSSLPRHRDHHHGLFPPYMFYTVKNRSSIDPKAAERIAQCQQLNKDDGYQAEIYDDDTSRRFVQEHYPQFLELYDYLGTVEPVWRADMCRYLILHRYGGVYLDSDVVCKLPIDSWDKMLRARDGEEADTTAAANGEVVHPRIGAMAGIEIRGNIDADNQTGMPEAIQFVQWTMAAQRPAHPIFYRTVEIIKAVVDGGGYQSTNEQPRTTYTTGPGVFTQSILEYLVERGRIRREQWSVDPNPNHVFRHLLNDSSIGTTTNEIVGDGDLAIVDKNAFAHVGGNPSGSGPAFVLHKFAASWKRKRLSSNQVAKPERGAPVVKTKIKRGRKFVH